MSESETMRHWKSVKGNDPSELALAMADFAREMEKQRDAARRVAQDLWWEKRVDWAFDELRKASDLGRLPWEVAELEREPMENA